jgi:glycosyltransferase involved in cell wall biosynthesis
MPQTLRRAKPWHDAHLTMPAPPPISVVCSDTSDNCLGRALVLAEVLAAFGAVRVVGPQLKDGIWRPALSSSVEVRGYPLSSAIKYRSARRWLRRELSGSRVVVSKPRATSFGLSLAAGVSAHQMLLDIDDWELGFMNESRASLAGRATLAWSRAENLLAPASFNSYWSTRVLDSLSRKVPRRLVSNSFLRERFGGVVLPHVRDTDRLDPRLFREQAAARRAELGMSDRPFVAFIGTIREHKGVDDLVQAVAMLEGPAAPGLLLAGVDFEHAFSRRVLDSARSLLPPERLRIVGMFDSAEVPIWVALSDVICIPSRDIPGAWGQLPAKLFDAMSMARPVVSSDVNDIGRILEGCGLTFPGGDVNALSAQLARILADSALAARLASAGRQRAIEGFSVASGRRATADIVNDLPVFAPNGRE